MNKAVGLKGQLSSIPMAQARGFTNELLTTTGPSLAPEREDMITDPEQALFEALTQQLCRTIDHLTATVGEVARRLEVALGGLEAEVAQIHQELDEMNMNLVVLGVLTDIDETLKGLAGGMP